MSTVKLKSIYFEDREAKKIIRNNEVIYREFVKPIDYSKNYLTLEILSAGTINLSRIDFSNDNGANWTTIGSTTTAVNVSAGEKVIFRKTSSQMKVTFAGNNVSVPFNVEGNIMSVIYGDNFAGQTRLTSQNAFESLFSGSSVVSAENLVLPAVNLSSSCYLNMFKECRNLTTAPKELPATSLQSNCYKSMFEQCSSLTGVSKDYLPSTTLEGTCYRNMFSGCTSLATAPDLPAETLSSGCYQNMFNGCANLDYIKCLASTTASNIDFTNWVYGVAATGTFVKKSGVSWWATGVDGIPDGWTVQEE